MSSHLPKYLRDLLEYIDKPTRTIIGLHSGTSADGPTAVVAKVSGAGKNTAIEVIAFDTFDYESPLKEKIFDLFDRETSTVDKIAQADMAIGEAFSKAAFQIVESAELSFNDVDLIASSGQVCYQVIEGHRDDHRWLGDHAITSFTDLGAGAVIAERTGITTVSNLRQRDIAAGGLGVPTVTYGDWALFRHPDKTRVIQNIGGIANPTVIPAGAEVEDVFAFDTGPGNMLIDGLVRIITDGRQNFDAGGEMASRGEVHQGLLKELMDHPFIKLTPPKGAAQQLFGGFYANKIESRRLQLNIDDYDLLATVTEFTVESIIFAYENFIFPRVQVDEVFVAGGGAYNKTIMRSLSERLSPIPVGTTADLGIPIEAREVLAMVVIANETVQGNPGNVPNATGATHRVISGDITPGR